MPRCINGVVTDIANIERIAPQGWVQKPLTPEEFLAARDSESLNSLGLGGAL